MRVDSVTSTCLRLNFGDMTTFSAPMVPGSSGGLPGHRSTTFGLSAPAAGQIRQPQETMSRLATIRAMVDPRFDLIQPEVELRLGAWRGARQAPSRKRGLPPCVQ